MVTHFKHHMGENLEDYYKLGDVLGTGSFSKVIRATELATGKDFAVKCMTKEGDERKTEIITTEIEILKRVDHPNVVKLHEIFETDTDLYIVMQLINGGELFEKIVQLTCYTEQDASKIVRQLLLGIQGLHSKRVVHRDLKPENLLLSDDSFDADVLITDFGLSFVLPDGEDLMLRAVGTPGYIAPEVLATLDTGEGYGREIDLWSAGVIMYILLCGFPPFYGDDEEEVYEKTETGDYSYPSPFWDNISDLAKDMIDGLLRLDPRQRLTMDDALSHPWIQQFESLPKVSLQNTVEELRKFNAKRKFRGAVKGVLAIQKMQNSITPLNTSASGIRERAGTIKRDPSRRMSRNKVGAIKKK